MMSLYAETLQYPSLELIGPNLFQQDNIGEAHEDMVFQD